MIPIQCDCGRTLKLKDELAGKRVRCPDCSEMIKVPKAEDEDENWEDMAEDDSEELPTPPPRAKKSSARSPKKSSSKKSRRAPGSGITSKKIFGGLILVLGVALLGAIVVFIVSGEFQPKRLGGLILPFAMIGMGWAWIKGETYGG